MTRRICTLLAGLLLGCANPSKTGPTTGASVASAPAPTTPTPAAPPTQPAAGGAAAEQPPSLASKLPPPTPGVTPEAPPAGDAAVATQVEGCLAALEPPPEEQTRSFVPRPDRVEVKAEADSITVAHHLSHACCLKSQTAIERAGSSVTLIERLSGTPCRCRCASVMRTRIPLTAGDYELGVRVEEPGGTRTVHQSRVKVGAGTSTAPKLPDKIKVDLKPKH